MGRVVRDRRALERIDALRIPPAWRDVRVAASARSNIQAWGFDARDRKQYRYHDRAVERRERRKYYRMRELAKSLPKMRTILRADAARHDLTRQTVAATVLRLPRTQLRHRRQRLSSGGRALRARKRYLRHNDTA